jgi:transcriptional regulator with XRE-family HTH domain
MISHMAKTDDFATWLQNELDIRGWRQVDLVRKAGIHSGFLSKILSRERRPGVGTCAAMARAFNLSEEEVLRRAGLLSTRPVAKDDTPDTPRIRDLIKSFLALEDEDQEHILKEMRALNALKNRRRSPASTREAKS